MSKIKSQLTIVPCDYTRVPRCAVPGSRASSITSTPSHTVLKNCLMKIQFFKTKNKLWQKIDARPWSDYKKLPNRPSDLITDQSTKTNLDAEHTSTLHLSESKNIKKFCGKKCPVLQHGFILCCFFYCRDRKKIFMTKSTHTHTTYYAHWTFYNVFILNEKLL